MAHAQAIAAIDLCVVPSLTFERFPRSDAGPWPAAPAVVRGDATSDGWSGWHDNSGVRPWVSATTDLAWIAIANPYVEV